MILYLLNTNYDSKVYTAVPARFNSEVQICPPKGYDNSVNQKKTTTKLLKKLVYFNLFTNFIIFFTFPVLPLFNL